MNKKTFLEVSITTSVTQRELLIPTLVEIGFQGFLEEEPELKSYMDVSGWNDEKFQSLKNEIKTLLQTISSNAGVKFRVFQEENWNEQWERSLLPVEVGKRLVIKPSWTDYTNVEGRLVIQIDPKMSFGTGYHETTRLTLTLLEKYLQKGTNILDVGTGTGILAIAAVKLGASKAIGIDIDEWSIDNAKENAIANHVADNVEISFKSISELGRVEFDLILANLTLDTNLGMLTGFKTVLKESGILLLSGLLRHDREKMIEGLDVHGYTLLEEAVENEWIALAAKR